LSGRYTKAGALAFFVMAIGVAMGIVVLGLSSGSPVLTLASTGVVLVSFYLVHATIRAFDVRRLTIPGAWYLAYIATVYIPGFAIYEDGIQPYKERFMFAMQSNLITVPLGFLLCNLVLNFKPREIKTYLEKDICSPKHEPGTGVIYAVLLMMSFGVAGLYLTQVQHIALIEMLKNPGAWEYYTDVRLESFVALKSSLVFAYAQLRGMLFPFLMASSLGYYLFSRKGQWLAIFIVTSLAGLGFASLDASKGPVAIVIIIIGFFFYLYKGGRVKFSAAPFWFVVILAFPVFILMTAGGAHGWQDLQGVLQNLNWRIFESNPAVAYKYFEIFPDEIAFLHGRSIQKVAILMGEPYVDTGVIVFRHFWSSYQEGNSAGGAFFARFYSDFGMSGVLAGGVLTGLVLQGVQVLILRRRKTIAWLAVYSFVMYTVWAINGESLPSVLLGGGIAFSLALPWLIELGAGLVAGKKAKSDLEPRKLTSTIQSTQPLA
jgi:uncharacterized protein (DUF983 family)